MAVRQTQVTVRVAQVVHDVVAEKSLVKLVWPDDDRRLHLPIPFATALNSVHPAAEEALREHERNITNTLVGPGPSP